MPALTPPLLPPAVLIRAYAPSDDPALATLVAAECPSPTGWPPAEVCARGEYQVWLAAPCTWGRWVAVRSSTTDRTNGEHAAVVGHIGLGPVVADDVAAHTWCAALGRERTALAKVGRGVVAAHERRHGTAGRLSRVAVRASVNAGLVPVACARADRSASLAMMRHYGWVAAGVVRASSGAEITAMIPPPALVAAADAARAAQPS